MSFRSALRRPAVIGASALALGSLLAAGFSGAAFAVSPGVVVDIHLTSATGATVKGAEIDAYPVSNRNVTFPNLTTLLSGSGFWEAKALDTKGNYELDLPATGDYTLTLGGTSQSGTSSQFLGGSSVATTSRVLSVDSAQSAISISYAPSGAISGKVTTASGKGIKNACAVLWTLDGGTWVPKDGGVPLPAGVGVSAAGYCDAITSTSGAYSVNPGSAGSYKVEFYDQGAKYLDQFSNGATDVGDAPAVYLAANGSATVNTTLSLGGTLKGSFSVADSAYVSLSLQQLVGTPGHFTSASSVVGQQAEAGAHGGFTFSDLATGYYVVEFDALDDTGAQSGGFIGGATALTASYYSVVAGATTTAPTSTSSATNTGSIAATVTHDGSAVIDLASDDGSAIELFNADGTAVYFPDAPSDSNGTYTFSGLAPGEYSVVVNDLNDSGVPIYEPAVEAVDVATTQATVSVALADPSTLSYASQPTIAEPDSVEVGQTFSVDAGTVDSADNSNLSVSYQWYHQVGDDQVAIAGAQSASYTARAGDIGSHLSARVVTTRQLDVGGIFQILDETVSTVATATDPVLSNTNQIVNVSAPTIPNTGDGKVGSTLAAYPGSWSVAGTRYSYQWETSPDGTTWGNVSIGGLDATQATYTPTADDLGQYLRVLVTATKDGYPSSDPVASSNFVDIAIGDAPVATTAPKVTYHSGATRTFSATPGTWSVPGGTISYVWLLNGNQVDAVGAPNKFSTTNPGAVTLEVDDTGIPGHSDGSITELAAIGAALSVFYATTPPLTAYDYTTGEDVTSTDPGEAVAGPYVAGDQVAAMSTATAPDNSAVTQTETITYKSGDKYISSGWTWNEQGLPPAMPTVVVGKPARLNVSVSSPDYYGTTKLEYPLLVLANSALTGKGTVTVPTSLPVDGTASAVVTGYPSGTAKTYQWEYSADSGSTWTKISKATTSSLALGTPLVAGDEVRVVVVATRSGSTADTETSNILTVDSNEFTAIGSPLLSASGPVKVGATVTATPGTYDVSGVTASYQWQVSADGGADWSNSSTSANKSSYKVTAADVGENSQLRVEVTAAKDGYTPASPYDGVSDSLGVVVVADPTDKLFVTPQALGAAVYGTPVAAPDWTSVFSTSADPAHGLDGSTVSYKWKLDGTSIPSTNESSYPVKASQIGHKLSVELTIASPLYGSASYTTKSVTITKGASLALTVHTSVSDAYPGVVITATPSISGQPTTYQWELTTDRGTTWKSISGATKSTYAATDSQAGDQLAVIAKVTPSGYSSTTATSSAVQVDYAGEVQNYSAPAIVSAQVGRASTVDPGDWSVAGTPFTYQWQLDGVDIPGATAATYTPVGTDAQRDLSVIVTSAKAGWFNTSETSGSLEVADGALPTAIAVPQVGATDVCSLLAATPGTWSVAGATVTYQWLRGTTATSFSAVSPADTTSSYQTVSGDAGEQFEVAVTVRATGYPTATYTTPPTEALTAGCAG